MTTPSDTDRPRPPDGEAPPDPGRRKLLIAATSIAGGAGIAAASIPFIASMTPSERARTAGAPVDADFSGLEPGRLLITEWRGKPLWILHRTEAMLKTLQDPAHVSRLADPDSKVASQQPAYARNVFRSIKPAYLVVVPICTHLGCVPTFRPEVAPPDLGTDWRGGLFCPCHGSKFDLAGRVYRNVPAPTNLVIPPYRYLGETRVRVGVDPEGTA